MLKLQHPLGAIKEIQSQALNVLTWILLSVNVIKERSQDSLKSTLPKQKLEGNAKVEC